MGRACLRLNKEWVPRLILTIENVKKVFVSGRKKVQAIDELSISLERGEFLCVVGPSGCGKSTLLNMVAGLEKSSAGRIMMNGREIREAGTDRTVMFQDSALFPWLRVIDNVEFGMMMAGVHKKARREKALKYLQMVHLLNFTDSWIHELSGGMRQRVALARALTLDSELLLMDEPFAALDSQTRRMLQEELLQIWRETGKTILFVTHSVEEAVLLADRVAIMTAGPGRLKKEFRIDETRPRDLKSPALSRLVAGIAEELKSEVDDIVRQGEEGIGSFKKDPVLSDAGSDLGNALQDRG